MLPGYSFKSSQYGLAVDNVAGYELVLPNGTVINVTSKDDDLWFGLRVSLSSRYRLDSLSIQPISGRAQQLCMLSALSEGDSHGLLGIDRES